MGCGSSRAGIAFINAAREGNANKVEAMLADDVSLARFADPTTQMTALHMAAIAPVAKEERLYVRCIEALIRAGAAVDSQIDGANMTPLFFAIRAQKTKLVHALLAAGADVRRPRDNRGWSALHFAVAESRSKAIESRTGLTPSDSTILKQILNARANVDSTTESGYTALHLACKHEKAHMVQILLSEQYRATPSLPDPNGDTPLHYAVKLVDQPNAVRALLRAGADVDALNHAGQAPIHLAAAYNNGDAIEQLAQFGAKLDLLDRTGMSASSIAYQRGHLNALTVLDRVAREAAGTVGSPGSGGSSGMIGTPAMLGSPNLLASPSMLGSTGMLGSPGMLGASGMLMPTQSGMLGSRPSDGDTNISLHIAPLSPMNLASPKALASSVAGSGTPLVSALKKDMQNKRGSVTFL